MSPIFGVFGGASARSFGLSQFLISVITDLWARTTSGGLGTSPVGNVWVNTSGTWTASNNGLATTATAASSYPLATVPFKVQSTMTAQNTSQGAGIAFWVTASNSWWAASTNAYSGSYQTGTSCTSSSCSSSSCNSYTNACTGYGTCCTGYTSSCSGYSSSCAGYSQFCSGFGKGYSCGGYSCSGYTSSCAGYSSSCSSYGSCCTSYGNVCNGYTCTGYTCNAYTPTYGNIYYWGVSLLQSVTGTVTAIASNLMQQSAYSSGSNLINSLKVQTSAGSSSNIVITAFSDTANATSLGSSTQSGTSPAGAVSAGIILSPSSLNQGSTIGAINYI